ncbi:MAG: DUF4350 domain-containing protein [Pseudolysinimonas sp.]
MSTSVRIRQEDPEQESLTPTVRRTARRAAFWVVIGVALILVAIVLVVLRGNAAAGIPLAADNPAPAGAMALAEVLRQHGVDVIETSSLSETEDLLTGHAGQTTVLLWDIDVLLDAHQHERLLRATDYLVVLDPTFLELEDLAPGIAQAGGTDGEFDADCDVTAVQKAGSVDAGGAAYRIVDDILATGCLADDDRYGLVETRHGGGKVTVLGLTEALSNGEIIKAGNAALALNLLGAHETLIWYIPGTDDLSDQAPLTIGDLTPPWVFPFGLMILLVALGAIFWRARRVGPLVVENLPVVVRASETMEGRARLYERSNSRLHALDALRIGTVARLARTCGLPRTASVTEVVDAVAALTGRDREAVAGILIDHAPTTDSELVHLSDQLLRLEYEASERSRP